MTFAKEISLGNVLSALTMLVVATLFVAAIRSGNEKEMTELRGEMKVYSSRLQQLTEDFNDFKRTNSSNAAEIRQQMTGVSQSIADMRVLIATQRGVGK